VPGGTAFSASADAGVVLVEQSHYLVRARLTADSAGMTEPRAHRPSPNAATHWRKFLAGGRAVLVWIVVVTTITGVGNSMWLPTMILLLGAVMATTTGLVLGVVHFVDTRPRKASS
jgi:hypothetical protein